VFEVRASGAGIYPVALDSPHIPAKMAVDMAIIEHAHYRKPRWVPARGFHEYDISIFGLAME